MSDALRRIRELCGALGEYAQTMDDRRADHPVDTRLIDDTDHGTPLWGGTVGTRSLKANGTAFWFDDIEPLYAELDELIRYARGDLSESIVGDRQIRDLAPRIHRIRAAYERDKELVQARNLARAEDTRARLENIIEQESYWALGEELRGSLEASRNVLVAGSGPLPLTALCIGAALDVDVTCVERDAECHALGRRLIAASGVDASFESINADILDIEHFDDYDAIVGVVLLGVATDSDRPSSRSAIARHIIDHMAPGTCLVMRDPHGLGKLLYPSIELPAMAGVEVTRPDTTHAH